MNESTKLIIYGLYFVSFNFKLIVCAVFKTHLGESGGLRCWWPCASRCKGMDCVNSYLSSALRKRHSVLSAFPMLVPSLSW